MGIHARLAPAALALACVALAPAARAQEPHGPDTLTVQVEGRATVLTEAVSPSAAVALGGVGGALAARALRRIETVAVLQGDREVDARVRGERRVVVDDLPAVQRLELQAEAIVVRSLPLRPEEGASARLPVRSIYARGFVRLEVELPGRGTYLVEGAEVYLDLARERAYVRQGELRAERIGPHAAPLVVAAEQLRLEGTDRFVAEQARVSVCELGVPHLALLADRVELTAPPARRGSPLLARLIDPEPDRGARGGSDATLDAALARERERSRRLEVRGVSLQLYPPGLGFDGPARVPLLPWLGWRSEWPFPEVRVGQSSRLGTFARVGLGRELVRQELPGEGELRVAGEAAVEYFSRRGTGGEVALAYRRLDPDARELGAGFFRAYGLRDRADEDRVGTPIPSEGRYWLRGLVREHDDAGTHLDAELSKLSDRGFLLEYFRDVALTEKEQETYVYLRRAWDDLGARVIGRFRLNDFQEQVERLPEARIDWISTPIVVDPLLGGLYLDVAARGGHLRRRFDELSPLSDYRAWRFDSDAALIYKQTLGPLIARGEVGARETLWSGRAADEDLGIDRFAARAAWSLTTVLWRDFELPFGTVRHEIMPEVGTRHVFAVSRDPAALLAFDEVERLEPTDHVFVRLRTRLLADVERRRHKLIDLAVEARYFLRDIGSDRGRSWSLLRGDLRLGLAPWLALRTRLDHDVNRGRVRQLDAMLSARPLDSLLVSGSYHELRGFTRAVAWEARWRLTPAWMVAVDQQLDLRTGAFLRHRARLVRFFHRVAVEVTLGVDPQNDDVAASFSIAPAWDFDQDPFVGDRFRGIDPGVW